MRFVIQPAEQLRKAPFVGPKGGLWADAQHKIHWDPKKHGETKPVFVAADLITSDDMAQVVERLGKLSKEALQKLMGEINKRSSAIEVKGDAVPSTLMRWWSAVNKALKIAKPKAEMKAPAPKKPEPPKKARPPQPQSQLGFTFTEPAPKGSTTDPEAQTAPGPEASAGGGDGGLAPEASAAPPPKPELKPKSEEKKEKAKPKTVVPRAKAKTRGSRGELGDVGEHVWGSRKDLAKLSQEIQAGDRKLEASDLEGMDYSDAAYLVTKQNLFEPRTLGALREEGKTPGCASLSLAIMAAVKSKAPDSNSGRRQYMKDARLVQGTLDNCKTYEDVTTALREWQDRVREASKLDVKNSRMPQEEARALAAKLSKEMGVAHKVYSKFNEPGYLVASKAAKPFDSLGSQFTGMVRYSRSRRQFGNKYLQEAKYTARQAESLGDAGWEVLKHAGVLKGEEAATKKAQLASRRARRQKESIGKTSRGISTAKEVAGEVTRKGGPEIKEANPGRVVATFGFGNLQHGNYMSQADREYHTKALEAALYDFSEVLGIPPKTVSLNGRLSVALGARGKGRAAAHYESDRKIINLTKFSGGGSLAHEWGHALDNVLAEHYTSETSSHGTYLSDKRDSGKIPPPMQLAFGAVWRAMTEHPNPEESRKTTAARISKLRDEKKELIDKHNTMVREVNALRSKVAPEHAERRVTNLKERIKSYKESKKLLEEKDKRLTQQRGKGRVSMAAMARQGKIDGYAYRIKDTKEALAAIQEGSGVKSKADLKRIEFLIEEAEYLNPDINRVTKELNLAQKQRGKNYSQFHANSKEAGEYHSHPWEMFARSFETYVEDKLKAVGRANTYLVSGLAGPVYPHGEERKRITAAIDGLMSHLKETGLIEKSMARMFPYITFTVPLEKALPEKEIKSSVESTSRVFPRITFTVPYTAALALAKAKAEAKAKALHEV